ncbi:MAG: MlaD family protein [Salinisphaera sp.]|jgi:phospholipid/cholesterol/gamma-HCH transport system substrate-binding protein|nr:MlaD family protein [Salinisphaera sp.]
MESRSHALIASIFLVVLFVGAAFAAWWLQAGRSEDKIYKILSPYGVSGLKAQAPVMFKGIRVGSVHHVELDPNDPEKVLIRIGVTQNTPVTKATYAQLSSNGITGVSSIALHEKKPHAPALKTDHKHPATVPIQRALTQRLEQSGKKIAANVQDISHQLKTLLDKKNKEYISKTLAQLDAVTSKLNAIEAGMLPIVNDLPKLLDAAQKTMAQGSGLMRQSHSDAVELHRLLGSSNRAIESFNNDVMPKLGALTDQLNLTANHVDALTQRLQRNPDSLLFGGGKAQPGPGEPGYEPPK